MYKLQLDYNKLNLENNWVKNIKKYETKKGYILAKKTRYEFIEIESGRGYTILKKWCKKVKEIEN